MRHPLKEGRLLYDIMNHEIVEIRNRHLEIDNGMWVYRVSDPTHTSYSKVTEKTVETRYKPLPITVHNNRKSGYILDLEDLVENMEEAYGYENLDSTEFKQTPGEVDNQ